MQKTRIDKTFKMENNKLTLYARMYNTLKQFNETVSRFSEKAKKTFSNRGMWGQERRIDFNNNNFGRN